MNDLVTNKAGISEYGTEKIIEGICTWFNGLSEKNQTTIACTTVVSLSAIVVYGIHKGCGFKKYPDGTCEITNKGYVA